MNLTAFLLRKKNTFKIITVAIREIGSAGRKCYILYVIQLYGINAYTGVTIYPAIGRIEVD